MSFVLIEDNIGGAGGAKVRVLPSQQTVLIDDLLFEEQVILEVQHVDQLIDALKAAKVALYA